MSEIIDKHLEKVYDDQRELEAWTQDTVRVLENFFDFTNKRRFAAITWGGYALMLMLRHYPEEMEFSLSIEEREEFIKKIEEKNFRFDQSNHDDGSITVRVVLDKKEEDAS